MNSLLSVNFVVVNLHHVRLIITLMSEGFRTSWTICILLFNMIPVGHKLDKSLSTYGTQIRLMLLKSEVEMWFLEML